MVLAESIDRLSEVYEVRQGGVTSTRRRWCAAAKKSSETDVTLPPSAALDNSVLRYRSVLDMDARCEREQRPICAPKVSLKFSREIFSCAMSVTECEGRF